MRYSIGACSAIAEQAPIQFRMVAYDGGNPAVIATAGGETVATTQLAVEQSEMIRGGRLRPLAALSASPLVIEGIEPIPSITDWLPDMPVAPDYFGIFIPAGRRRKSTTPSTASGPTGSWTRPS